MTHGIQRIALALVASAPLVIGGTGCASRAQHVSSEEVEQLRHRVAELERNSARMRVRIEDGESRLYLLNDRVEANRIAMQQRASVEPGAHAWQQQQQQSNSWGMPQQPHRGHVQSAAPRPSQGVNSRGIPDLPVQNLRPEFDEPVPDGEGDEVVIDMRRYNELYGGESGSSPAPARSSGQALQPLANVIPSDDRIPSRSGDGSAAPSAAPVDGRSALEVYQAGLQEFNEREYREAMASMRRVLEMGPPPNYTDNAIYWIGESLYGLGEYEDALRYFQRVVSDHGDGNKAADALLKVALTHERLQDTASAMEALRVLVDTHPGTNSARRAAERLRELE